MKLAGRVVCVTGGARGIGAALCRRFVRAGAAAVYVADVAVAEAEALSRELGSSSVAIRCDVAQERDLIDLVARATSDHGRVDLFCSNAGIAVSGGLDAADADWQRAWTVNVMSHVWGVRAVLPQMLARGEGALLHTASAAGLLTSLGAAPYAITKHAVVSLAEWLAITYGAAGIQVACLCPQGVKTEMMSPGVFDKKAARAIQIAGTLLPPESVADAALLALEEKRFLALPHPEVAAQELSRAQDRDRWLAGMQRLWLRL